MHSNCVPYFDNTNKMACAPIDGPGQCRIHPFSLCPQRTSDDLTASIWAVKVLFGISYNLRVALAGCKIIEG